MNVPSKNDTNYIISRRDMARTNFCPLEAFVLIDPNLTFLLQKFLDFYQFHFLSGELLLLLLLLLVILIFKDKKHCWRRSPTYLPICSQKIQERFFFVECSCLASKLCLWYYDVMIFNILFYEFKHIPFAKMCSDFCKNLFR